VPSPQQGSKPGALVSRVRFRRKSAGRCVQRQSFAAHRAGCHVDPRRAHEVEGNPGADRCSNDRNERDDDNFARAHYLNLPRDGAEP
jgi:hypothetical protein